LNSCILSVYSFFFQAEDGIRAFHVTGVQTCALPILFVFHLPSKREKDINRPRRDVILTDIRERIMLMNDLGESVLLMGDFNENPDEENIKNITFGSNNEKILSNPYEDLFLKGKFSTFHRHFGLLVDQMLLSDDF